VSCTLTTFNIAGQFLAFHKNHSSLYFGVLLLDHVESFFMSVPADVLFAQKASAVAKCAGLDPKSLDLEDFRTSCPYIFTRAFCTIYKQKLEYDPEQYPERATQEMIEELYAKTGVAVLNEITGVHVCAGSHRAIGILVGVLFAEGQRAWVAKQERKKLANKDRSMSPPKSPKPPSRPTTAGVTRTRRYQPETEEDGYNDEDNEGLEGYCDEGFEGDDTETGEEHLSQDVEALRNEVAALQAKLEKGTGGRKRGGGKKPSKAGRRLRAAKKGAVEQSASAADRPPSRSPSPPSRGGAKGVISRGGGVTRPTSAPHSRHHRKVKAVSKRLYDPDSMPCNFGNLGIFVEGGDPAAEQAAGRPGSNKGEKKNTAAADAPSFTYDMKSGRKVFMSDAELQALERRREMFLQAAAEEQEDKASRNLGPIPATRAALRAQRERERTNREANPSPPGSPSQEYAGPTMPVYPGPATGRATDDWIAKQNAARDLEGLKVKAKMEKLKDLVNPRFYGLYSQLQPGDLIVSVEHCHSCAMHNSTLRHVPAEYAKNANQYLSIAGQIAHDCNLKVRLGLSRFCADLRADHNPSQHVEKANSRVGAFEVQVAYKDRDGFVRMDLLHSKLVTRRWPSKQVIEKRLRAFVAKHRIDTYANIDDSVDYSDHATDLASAGGGEDTYPVGAGPWGSTPVGLMGLDWEFPCAAPVANQSHHASSPKKAPMPPVAPVGRARPTLGLKKASTQPSLEAVGDPLDGVVWAYDSREYSAEAAGEAAAHHEEEVIEVKKSSAVPPAQEPEEEEEAAAGASPLKVDKEEINGADDAADDAADATELEEREGAEAAAATVASLEESLGVAIVIGDDGRGDVTVNVVMPEVSPVKAPAAALADGDGDDTGPALESVRALDPVVAAPEPVVEAVVEPEPEPEPVVEPTPQPEAPAPAAVEEVLDHAPGGQHEHKHSHHHHHHHHSTHPVDDFKHKHSKVARPALKDAVGYEVAVDSHEEDAIEGYACPGVVHSVDEASNTLVVSFGVSEGSPPDYKAEEYTSHDIAWTRAPKKVAPAVEAETGTLTGATSSSSLQREQTVAERGAEVVAGLAGFLGESDSDGDDNGKSGSGSLGGSIGDFIDNALAGHSPRAESTGAAPEEEEGVAAVRSQQHDDEGDGGDDDYGEEFEQEEAPEDGEYGDDDFEA
jgi:hypothetical protein